MRSILRIMKYSFTRFPIHQSFTALSYIVIFRVKRGDVMHSFAIPRFGIGEYEVKAGKVKEIEFDAQRAGSFKYLCWLWCSKCHGDLKGRVVVSSNEE